jgi:hypothetical protein
MSFGLGCSCGCDFAPCQNKNLHLHSCYPNFSPISNAFFIHVDYDIGFDSGGNADYTMDLHQKEQLHDNTLSMMQSQHFSVSLYVKWKFSNSKCCLFVLSDTSFLHSADREICWVQLRRGLFILSSSAATATATCPSCQ